MISEKKTEEAVQIIRNSRGNGFAYTGAGISVESGIPPFRGKNGLWEQVNPDFIELENFYRNPEQCWKKIREVFYDHWGQAQPNAAHKALTVLQKKGLLGGIITQNIDCLHQRAGSKDVVEFHGTLDHLNCTGCAHTFPAERKLIDHPVCPDCGALLKPAFVFFGEGIPEEAFDRSFAMADHADFVLVIGTTGEVMPACMVPRQASRNGAKIIEINPERSALTGEITDCFLQGTACEVMNRLLAELETA